TGAPVTTFVLLLQEAFRAGPEVPMSRDARWAGAELRPGPHGVRLDVTVAARQLGLSLVYVPSMRNGAPGVTSEDRGNAVLSTQPIHDVTAIELPLERQRRVAILAAIPLKTDVGTSTTVRVVSTHFTNMVGHHLWLLSEFGRLRQARALSKVLPTEGTLVIGGGFNPGVGRFDAAYPQPPRPARPAQTQDRPPPLGPVRLDPPPLPLPPRPATASRQLARYARRAQTEDRRPTFGPMRLDPLLFRLPDGWKTTTRRANQKYGSDHYPLVATVTLP